MPTLFWLGASDGGAARRSADAGVALSAAALLGATNALVQLALWALYMSFVHVGQIFYGYGWEIQLLETGFLAVFLCPVRSVRPLPATRAPAHRRSGCCGGSSSASCSARALIKLRNDPCWRDLTCLDYHFETQPNPNPLAWWLHHAPARVHAVGVLFNHFVELVVPWFAFGFRRWRHAAGVAARRLPGDRSSRAATCRSSTGSPSSRRSRASTTRRSARFVPRRPRGRAPRALRGARPRSRCSARAAQRVSPSSSRSSASGPCVNLLSCDQAMNRASIRSTS